MRARKAQQYTSPAIRDAMYNEGQGSTRVSVELVQTTGSFSFLLVTTNGRGYSRCPYLLPSKTTDTTLDVSTEHVRSCLEMKNECKTPQVKKICPRRYAKIAEEDDPISSDTQRKSCHAYIPTALAWYACDIRIYVRLEFCTDEVRLV